jgi:hypothetical protein
MRKDLSENYLKFGLGSQKLLQPSPRPKVYRTSVLKAPIYKLVRGEKLLTCPGCSHVSGWPRRRGCKISTQRSMEVSPKRNFAYVVKILA